MEWDEVRYFLAVARSRNLIAALARGLPDRAVGQIKGIGNRIRHEYFRIDDAILWEVITTDTHALKTVMESMLARHAGEGSSGRLLRRSGVTWRGAEIGVGRTVGRTLAYSGAPKRRRVAILRYASRTALFLISRGGPVTLRYRPC